MISVRPLRFSSPHPVGRFALSAVLLFNLGAMATVSFASVEDNGRDVGTYCFLDNQYGTQADFDACVANLCHSRASNAEAEECKRKANAREKEMQAQRSQSPFGE